MNKKEIEKIPYLPMRKSDKYYVNAAEKTLSDGEKIFLIEIFKTKTPGVRFVFTKDDYATYEPQRKKWSRRKIENCYYMGKDFGDVEIKPYNLAATYHISNRVYDIIIKNIGSERTQSNFVETIHRRQQDIDDNRSSKNERRREEANEELMHSLPDMSNEFILWTKRQILPNRYAYCMEQKDITFVTCSKCGTRRVINSNEIDKKKKIQCLCGARGRQINEKTCKNGFTEKAIIYDIEKITVNDRPGAAVILYEATKTYTIGDPELYNWNMYSVSFYLKGRKTPTTLYRDTGWSNREPEEGISKRDKADALISPSGLKNLKETHLKYSGAEVYGKDIEEYLNAYLKDNSLEYFTKMGINRVTEAKMAGATLPEINPKEKSVSGKLGIYPERLEYLKTNDNPIRMWKFFQKEKEGGYRLKKTEIEYIAKKNPHTDEHIEKLLPYMSLTKIINYTGKKSIPIREYRDYIEMKVSMGYDMTDDINLFPRDFEEAHIRVSIEANDKKRRKEIIEKNNEYCAISKNYKKINKLFGFETDDFIIRPARNAGEIIEEGAGLHHCVGATDTYMKRHNEGRSYILFLRKKEKENIPWCTIEIGSDKEIKQWYEAYDKQPDKDEIQPLLDAYVEKIRRTK